MEQLLLQTSIGFSVWQKPTAQKVRKEDLVEVKAVQATSARQEAVSSEVVQVATYQYHLECQPHPEEELCLDPSQCGPQVWHA